MFAGDCPPGDSPGRSPGIEIPGWYAKSAKADCVTGARAQPPLGGFVSQPGDSSHRHQAKPGIEKVARREQVLGCLRRFSFRAKRRA
jgi:hypothetical protein